MKILLVVDDDVLLLDLLKKPLTQQGYTMIGIPHLKDSFETAKQLTPDRIMIDVILPDGLGYQLSRRVRSDKTLYRTPVLFVSSLAESPEVEHAMRQGGDAYLTKPFTLHRLLDSLTQLDQLERQLLAPQLVEGLLSCEAVKREMDYLIFRQIPFSLCLIAIEQFDAYIIDKGQERAYQALAWTGEMLIKKVRALALNGIHTGYLGHNKFLVVTPPQYAEPFQETVLFEFQQKTPYFYQDMIHLPQTSEKVYPDEMVQLHFTEISFLKEDHVNAQDMINHLIKMYKQACVPVSIFNHE